MTRGLRVLVGPVMAALTLALGVLLPGGVRPPAAVAQNPGIQIAGATSTAPLGLTRGCNQIIADSPNGVPVAGLATLVSPSTAVVSIWRYNNATQSYQVGFFANSPAPVDFTLIGSGGSVAAGRSTNAYLICVSQSAVLISG